MSIAPRMVSWLALALLGLGCRSTDPQPLAASSSKSFGSGDHRGSALTNATEHEITLLSYNVNFGLAGSAEVVDAIAAANADVVLLQETNEAWETGLRAALGGRYPHIAFHHCCRAGGLGILSRFPLSPKEVSHPDGAWFPAWRVIVDSPLGPIQTLNVHLRPKASDSGSFVVGFFTTGGNRRDEMARHVQLLEDDLPTVVAGDFNESRRGGAVRVLDRAGLRLVVPERNTWHWQTSIGELHAELDHVLIDGRLRAVEGRVLQVGPSDHYPLLVRLRAP
ncbi:MAG: endonuclease/exonuclease/phosphatase family protein [Polyangiaceae bacterium]